MPGEPLSPHAFARLRLSLTPGVGPTLIPRLIDLAGSAPAACDATISLLTRVRGIGQTKARAIADGLRASADRASEEIDLAAQHDTSIVTIDDPAYPPLLRSIPDPPQVLFVRGAIGAIAPGTYAVAIVGSRRCSSYGIEQAERFAGVFAQSGLLVVSGGARGIDTASHRGAVRAGGRTAVVLGCGLCHCYPPENRELFDRIVAEGRGVVISELPMRSPPSPENFPGRNRIISGLSLGVLVVEAGRRSGALITARQALEDHHREVMALPARVDNPLGEGSNELIKRSEAAMVTSPADAIQILEVPARHQHAGTHADRYGLFDGEEKLDHSETFAFGDERSRRTHVAPQDGAQGDAGQFEGGQIDVGEDGLARGERPGPTQGSHLAAVLEAMEQPASADTIIERTGLEVQVARAALTMLEIQGRVRRVAGRFERARG